MRRHLIVPFLIVLAVSFPIGCGLNNPPAGGNPSNGASTNTAAGGATALQWSFVDGDSRYFGLNTDSPEAYTSVLAEFDSKLYAAWQENNQIRVSVYSGDDSAPSWTVVDGGTGLSKEPVYGTAGSPQLIVLHSKLYALWTEGYRHWLGGTNYETRPTCVRAAVYNGDDSAPSWTFVDGGGDTTAMLGGDQYLNNVHPVVFNSKLYVSWNAGGIAVYNGNDTSPVWTPVDAGAVNGLYPQLAVLGSKLYVSFDHPQSPGINVMVYNGNDGAPVWTSVNGPMGVIARIPLAVCNLSTIAVLDGKLYLAWSEAMSLNYPDIMTNQIHVAVYNGNDGSPDWSFVDGDGFFGINKDPHTQANYGPSLAVANGKLYATWSETYAVVPVGQIRVAEFNGNTSSPAWSFVDGNEATGLNKDVVRSAESPFLVAFNSKLYATWNENSQIRVAVGK